MTVRRMLLVAVMGVGLLGAAITALAARSARERLRVAQSSLAETARQSGLVKARRSLDAEISAAVRPQQDLILRVNRALDRAGLDRRRFDGLTSAGDGIVSGSVGGASNSALRQQTVVTTFRNLRLAEIGKLLGALRDEAAAWNPSRIDVARRQLGTPTGEEASDRYDCTVTLVATYAAPTAGSQ